MKKSGLSSDRSHKEQSRFIRLVDETFSNGKHFYWTHDAITEELKKRIFSTPMWDKVSAEVRGYVNGYWWALREELYRNRIVWALSLDGKLMSSQDVRDVCKAEDATGFQSDAWSRIDSNLSRHVWTDKQGKPLYDKPYDARFLNL